MGGGVAPMTGRASRVLRARSVRAVSRIAAIGLHAPQAMPVRFAMTGLGVLTMPFRVTVRAPMGRVRIGREATDQGEIGHSRTGPAKTAPEASAPEMIGPEMIDQGAIGHSRIAPGVTMRDGIGRLSIAIVKSVSKIAPVQIGRDQTGLVLIVPGVMPLNGRLLARIAIPMSVNGVECGLSQPTAINRGVGIHGRRATGAMARHQIAPPTKPAKMRPKARFARPLLAKARS